MRRFLVFPLLLSAVVSVRPTSGLESGLPAGFELDTVVTGALIPVSLAFTPDGRLFYSELDTGRIRVVRNDSLLPDPFYRFAVDPTGEKGLLGLLVDPAYPDSPFVYVFYTDSLLARNRVVRLTDSLNVGTHLTVVLDSLPAGPIHNGGNLEFGPDGKLYVTVGDNGTSSNSDDPASLAGKILRFNRDGSIPSDNPFPGEAAYCLGLRNSFDFAFHPRSGELFATENGPTDWDEVNVIEPGVHYGWPFQKGPGGEPTYRDPIHAYPASIGPTGLTICTNTTWPAEYFDNVFFADFNFSHVRRMILSSFLPVVVDTVLEDWLTLPGFGAFLDVEFAPDEDLYFCDTSRIYRLRYTGGSTGVVPGAPQASALLLPNIPNPFNPSTRIPYRLLGPPLPVRLTVHGLSGARVRTLFEGVQGEGSYEVRWDGTGDDGRRVASGVYMVRLVYGGEESGRRVVLIE